MNKEEYTGEKRCCIITCYYQVEFEHHNFINGIEFISYTCKNHYDDLAVTVRELQWLWEDAKDKANKELEEKK